MKGNTNNLYYQIFIEPKGEHLVEHDKWKDDFLQQITNKYGTGNLLKAENEKYSLIGLPLFNNREENRFEEAFSEQLLK